MPNNSVTKIEGIGPAYGEKLKSAGIPTVNSLLKHGASKKGRDEIVEKTGISYDLILKWVNMADLFRVKGIGEEYSELLEVSGVDTVKELRTRNAENLQKKMKELNDEKKLVRVVPGVATVQKWVDNAKELEPMVTY